MRGPLIAFVVLAAASEGAWAAPQSGIQIMPVPARIEVSGTGEVKYAPDVATIGYTIRGEGPTSDDAVRAMTTSASRIRAATRIVDPATEPKTSEVKIAEVKSTECREQPHGLPQLSTGACAISGYVATQSVVVRTLAVRDSGTLVGLVGRAGGLNAHIAFFSVQDSRPRQQQAIIAAFADAATKAGVIASASHVQLGPILNISTGPRTDGQQIVVSGSRMAPPPPPQPPPVSVSVVPDLLTTNAFVTVVYSIIQ